MLPLYEALAVLNKPSRTCKSKVKVVPPFIVDPLNGPSSPLLIICKGRSRSTIVPSPT